MSLVKTVMVGEQVVVAEMVVAMEKEAVGVEV